MKKTLKKTLSIILTILMIATIVPFAFAADVAESDTNGDNVTWTLDTDGVLTISGTGAMTNYESYNDVPWASGRSSIISVVIEDGVTTIGKNVFNLCTNLKTITIPASVESIGSFAFSNCASLESITIPATVKNIESGAFSSCRSLNSITILNAECYIHHGNNYDTIPAASTIYGYPGSTAQYYAGTYNNRFICYNNDHDWKNLDGECADCDETCDHDWENLDGVCAICQYVCVHIPETDEAVAATCTETGLKEGQHCSLCNYVSVEQEVVPALGHVDADGDYVCDNGCGYKFENPADNCKHLCHCANAFIQFFWKIVNFIQKLFGMALNCICGATH